MPIAITPARSAQDFEAIGELFREYVDWLGIDLAFQGFEAELANLSAKYAPPAGELFLAKREDGRPVGCVGLSPFDKRHACELKRLYVRDEARGTGTGRALAQAAVAYATSSGYRKMLLDTLPSMPAAIAIYRSLGFAAIPPYYDNPVPGAIFFAKNLEPVATENTRSGFDV